MPESISVCVPTYEGERFVGQCIESVLAQTHSDFELVVCDDASTDGTVPIVEALGRVDSRVRLYRNEERLGLFENFNRCLSLARFPVVKILGQDDFLEPEALSLQVAALSAGPDSVLVACAKKLIDERDESRAVSLPYSPGGTVPGRQAARDNLIALQNEIGPPSAVLFRAGLAPGGFDSRFFSYGDLDYWVRILKAGNYSALAEPLVNVRLHEATGTTAAWDSLLYLSDYLVLEQAHREFMGEKGMAARDWRALVERHIQSCCAGIYAKGEPDIDTVLNACRAIASGDPIGQQVMRSVTGLMLFGLRGASTAIAAQVERDELEAQLASARDLNESLGQELARLEAELAALRPSSDSRTASRVASLARRLTSFARDISSRG